MNQARAKRRFMAWERYHHRCYGQTYSGMRVGVHGAHRDAWLGMRRYPWVIL